MAVNYNKENNELLKELSKNQFEMSIIVSNLKKEVSDLRGESTRILSYLDNDPKTGKKGMYERLNDSEKDISDLKGYKKFLIGIGAVILAIGGGFWGFFKFFQK